LPDEDVEIAPADAIEFRSFVKFFGAADHRVDRSFLVRDELVRSGCHWTCAYPKGKRPRQVEDGSVIFMGRLVRDKDDIVVFGRAIGLRHEPGRDDASPEEIAQRRWKRSWPHYVRVQDAEFLAGDLHGGVSLHQMMDELGPHSFASTQRNFEAGSGNTDPRRAYRRRADVELSPQGYRWMAERLDDAFAQHGWLSPAVLAALDWPE
jgi:hypothetical protein